MTKGWTLYDPRLAWMLVAPVVLLLIFFLVLPIAVMAVYTFFTFVTAGVEKDTLTLANWHEFLTDSYYHGFLVKTVKVVSPKPLGSGAAVTVVVRPQKLSLGSAATANLLSGRVVSTSYLGGSAIYEIDIGDKRVLRANTQMDGRLVREGEAVNIGFDPAACVLLDEKGIRIS